MVCINALILPKPLSLRVHQLHAVSKMPAATASCYFHRKLRDSSSFHRSLNAAVVVTVRADTCKLRTSDATHPCLECASPPCPHAMPQQKGGADRTEWLTAVSLEVGAACRGVLLPDPKHDAVK